MKLFNVELFNSRYNLQPSKPFARNEAQRIATSNHCCSADHHALCKLCCDLIGLSKHCRNKEARFIFVERNNNRVALEQREQELVQLGG